MTTLRKLFFKFKNKSKDSVEKIKKQTTKLIDTEFDDLKKDIKEKSKNSFENFTEDSKKIKDLTKKKINPIIKEAGNIFDKFMTFFKWVIYTCIFIFLLVLIIYSFFIGRDYFNNELKYYFSGYSKVNYEKDGNRLLYNDERMKGFIFIAINYNYNAPENITEDYKSCFIGKDSLDVECMYSLNKQEIPYLKNDRCEWVYFAYETAVKVDQMYLINHPERFCGSLSFRMHSHYLITFDGKFIKILDKLLAHRTMLQGKVNYYKVKEDGIEYTEKACRGHIEQNCSGLKDELLFLSFK